MDVFVLDELLRRTELIDDYESFIWTERYREIGDFQLVLQSTRGTRQMLTAGTRLAINESRRVMVIETIENKSLDDGTPVLDISGRSIETVMQQRSAWTLNVELDTVGSWSYVNTPGNIVREIFQAACVDGLITEQDRIPFYTPGTLLPAGNIPEAADVVEIAFDVQSAYEAIFKVSEVYNQGFRLIRNGDASQLYFEVYTGNDRTTLQTTLDPVIFSPELDNLTDTVELTVTSDYKNVAYVIGDKDVAIVYADGVPTTISGFERRVLMVKATDIDPDLVVGPEYTAALVQRGKEELAKHRAIVAFDGEIRQSQSYEYDVHYSLGDLVVVRNSDGLGTNVRVTEQIFVSDREGKRSYPTLTSELLITPGSWLSGDGNPVWLDADGTWAEA